MCYAMICLSFKSLTILKVSEKVSEKVSFCFKKFQKNIEKKNTDYV